MRSTSEMFNFYGFLLFGLQNVIFNLLIFQVIFQGFVANYTKKFLICKTLIIGVMKQDNMLPVDCFPLILIRHFLIF